MLAAKPPTQLQGFDEGETSDEVRKNPQKTVERTEAPHRMPVRGLFLSGVSVARGRQSGKVTVDAAAGLLPEIRSTMASISAPICSRRCSTVREWP